MYTKGNSSKWYGIFGMVWYGMVIVCFGMVWDVAWYGLVWYGMAWATLACKTLECMERCFEGLGGLTISPALCSMKARDKNQGARWLSQTYDGLLLLKKKEEEEVQDDIFLLHTFFKLAFSC